MELQVQVFRRPIVGKDKLSDKSAIGLEYKILEAYKQICFTWTDAEDEIILIGFSRGAFTAHALALLINDTGLLETASVNERLPKLFKLWHGQFEGDTEDERDNARAVLQYHCRKLSGDEEATKAGEEQLHVLRRKIRIKVCAVWVSHLE